MSIGASICQGSSYTLPKGELVTVAGTYKDTLQSKTGCDSIITTTLTVNPVYNSSKTASICQGISYTLPKGELATVSGTYKDTLLSKTGCDSIITTTLTVNPVYNSSKTASICQGSSYTLPKGELVTVAGTYKDTLQSKTGCDSIITTTLTVNPVYNSSKTANICQGISYTLPKGELATVSGTYKDTLLSKTGCDSIITTTLTVNPVYNSSKTASICQGISYTLPKGELATVSGTYKDTLLSKTGCDSIITTTLTVNPVYNSSKTASICQGSSYTLPKGELATVAGTYKDTLLSKTGCDSIISTILTMNPVYNSSKTASICQGSSYTLPKGELATVSGTYKDTLLSKTGCDSIITTTLTVNPVYNSSKTASICQGSSYTLPKGELVTVAGTYKDTLLSKTGCDSIITTTLTVNPVYNSSKTASICQGSSYTLPKGEVATVSGTYKDTLLSKTGCDSIITTTLTVNPVYNSSKTASICQGSSYTLPKGELAIVSGTYKDTLLSKTGCDSIITTTLTVNPVYNSSKMASICQGSSYILPKGVVATFAGTYKDTLLSKTGCDSIITTTLTVNPVYNSSKTASICQGSSYTLPKGEVATFAGTYKDTLLSKTGCDSIITTTLTVNPVYNSSKTASICQGSSYTLPKGKLVTVAGTYKDTLPSKTGCDSIITTTLTVNPVYNSSKTASICQGSSYILPKGEVATFAGTYKDTLLSKTGCDSIITTTLTVNPVYNSSKTASICQGSSYTLPKGKVVILAGTYKDTLPSKTGCDSIITITLTVNPVYNSSKTASICQGNSYTLPKGKVVTLAGTYKDTLLSKKGCDSIITTTITVNPVYNSSKTASICKGS